MKRAARQRRYGVGGKEVKRAERRRRYGVGGKEVKTTVYKISEHKDMLYSTGNTVFFITINGLQLKNCKSLCCTLETYNTVHELYLNGKNILGIWNVR